MRAPEDRFWEKVVEAVGQSPNGSSGCWIWTASLTPAGYGQFGVAKGHIVMAHRFAYEWVVGKIPAGLHIDHLCRERCCVNPAHLEPVTVGENLRRGEGPTAINAAKTTCLRGHPLSGANLYVDPRGMRQCKACRAAAVARVRLRKTHIRRTREAVGA